MPIAPRLTMDEVLPDLAQEFRPKAEEILRTVARTTEQQCFLLNIDMHRAVMNGIAIWAKKEVEDIDARLAVLRSNPVPVPMSATVKAHSSLKG